MSATVKLYYENPYLSSFESRVCAARIYGEGDGAKTELILERTCFYPESGGQIADRGSIEGVPVESVFEEKNGAGETVIIHRLEKKLDINAGATLQCAIDFDARFQNMQDHTSQHILSEAFIKTADLHTQSMHMGPGCMTIDLAVTSKHGLIDSKNFKLDRTILDAAETLANSIIHKNLKIESFFTPRAELSAYNLRKTPELEDDMVRLVSIKGYDNSLCCGTHLSSTGEAGAIKIIGQQKANSAVRVRFVTGMKALADYRNKNYIISDAAEYLSIDYSDLLKSLERLNAENKSLAKKKNELSDLLCNTTAERLSEGKYLENGIYWHEPPDAEFGELTRMGQIFSKACGSFGFVLINIDPAAGFFRFVIGKTVSYAGDVKKVFGEIASAFNIKGGGSALVSQGGNIAAERLEEFKILVKAGFSS